MWSEWTPFFVCFFNPRAKRFIFGYVSNGDACPGPMLIILFLFNVLLWRINVLTPWHALFICLPVLETKPSLLPLHSPPQLYFSPSSPPALSPPPLPQCLVPPKSLWSHDSVVLTGNIPMYTFSLSDLHNVYQMYSRLCYKKPCITVWDVCNWLNHAWNCFPNIYSAYTFGYKTNTCNKERCGLCIDVCMRVCVCVCVFV